MDIEQLYIAYKPLLFSLAYRMLGSVMDAEDIVHESFLTFDAAVKSTNAWNPKAYLCKIVTNRCIDRIRSASKQREVYIGPWLPEPVISEENNQDPLHRYLVQDSVSTAYMLLLQQLSWIERAVFLLREVFEYDYQEIAEMLGKSEANCRQIFHRSKRSLQNHSVETITSNEKTSALVNQFVHILSSGNVSQLLNILSSDAILYSDGGGKVQAAINPVLSAERIIRFLSGLNSKMPVGYSINLSLVNGQMGIVLYMKSKTFAVLSFEIRNEKIVSIYLVVNPDKLEHLNRSAVQQPDGNEGNPL
jgi:RNA polymerase sigma-70 factor (ECF subfamily)